MKIQIYLLITIALAILLISCGDESVTSPSSSNPSPIHFSLTQGTNTLSLTDSLVYSPTTYILTISNSSPQLMNSNFYRVSYSPSNALNIITQTSNTVSFQVANAELGSVSLTATHRNDSSLRKTVNLTLAKASYFASQIPISFKPTNTIFLNGTYAVSPIMLDSVANFFPKYPLSVSVNPPLPVSIVNNGKIYLTTGADVSTNLVTVTFSSANYVDYTTSFYVQVQSAPALNFSLTQGVNTLNLTDSLVYGNTYLLTITNSSPQLINSNFYNIDYSPLNALNIITQTSNTVSFQVANAELGSVSLTATHSNDSTLSRTVKLTLAKRAYPSGVTPIAYGTNNTVVASASVPGKISPSSDNRASYYPQGNLTLSKVSGPDTYSFNASSGEITFTGAGSYAFRVTFISSNYTDYTTPQFMVTVTVTVKETTDFEELVQSGHLAGLAASTNSLVTNTLTHLTTSANYRASTSLEARYATVSGAGDKSGTSWANAWAATDLISGINGNGISASATKVYAVLVASGTYKPTDGTDRTISFSMKNHVAIIGGFAASGSWERSGTTTFSGDIGNEGSTNDNSYNVFSHDSIFLDNGLLYGVTITGGNANGVAPHNSGGGMYNKGSSPRLVDVVFSDNSTSFGGGGMANYSSSSPVLTGVEFTGNSSGARGGGMYNERNSSPVLTRVEFTGNSSQNGGGIFNEDSSPVLTGVEFTDNSAGLGGGGMYNTASSPVLRGVVFRNNSSTGVSSFAPLGGGGMHNENSSPVLRGVVFVGNSANGEGGGMFNVRSSPVLVGAVFRGNSAKNGGGMYSYFIRSGEELVIANSIFAANSVTTGVGKDIVLDRTFSSTNISVRVAGSVLGVGEVNATKGIVVTNTGSTGGTVGSYNITYHSLANGAVDFGADATTSTATGGLTYPTIESGSSAVDIGLYVRKSGTTYYFSEDNSSWYTKFLATGGFDSSSTATPPTGAEDLTATDIAGNARVGRPDAGVHEYPTP